MALAPQYFISFHGIATDKNLKSVNANRESCYYQEPLTEVPDFLWTCMFMWGACVCVRDRSGKVLS